MQLHTDLGACGDLIAAISAAMVCAQAPGGDPGSRARKAPKTEERSP